MRITIRLLAGYRRYLPQVHDGQGGYVREVPTGCRVGEVMDMLNIPANDPNTFLVNGVHAVRDQVLHDGDVLAVFPAVGGG
jgi:molybdopterin converting factor small subunit